MNDISRSKRLQEVLQGYEVILLDDIPVGAQMERIDRKYAFPASRIPEVLTGLEPWYTIVEAAGRNISFYESTYLDTTDFTFYQLHQRGAANRDKIRFRSYPYTGTRFLEIKHKTNKGHTVKERIPWHDKTFELNENAHAFLRQHADHLPVSRLRESCRIDYRRIQFIARDQRERFSVDFEIEAFLDTGSISFGEVAILEVKQDVRSDSPIVLKMRDLRIFEASMSKYCLALTMLKPDLKSNRFKEDLRRLRKIAYEKEFST